MIESWHQRSKLSLEAKTRKGTAFMTNRLTGQTSPYLRQHQHNPVDWWPWSPEALAEAKASNRPILLSIGYAACHWCHVMAHESFENPKIAQIMNRDFINIKVDREERPDLDGIYQRALSLTGQQGGWPLTMFLTPDGFPFWGGTYFPPFSRYGRPGFADVLTSIAQGWKDDPDGISRNVATLGAGLSRAANPQGDEIPLTLDNLDRQALAMLDSIDDSYGGLVGAPKFPQPELFGFLWRAALRNRDGGLVQAVLLTLDNICQGGIYDHLGGGFMRYATDEIWLVPHFEKMLYDNAQLIDLLTLAWQATKSPLYQARINETVAWLLRDMTAEHGAFAATLDADSEGEEGKFYVWGADEIEGILGSQDARLFSDHYDINRHGNWDGHNILRRLTPLPQYQKAQSQEVEDHLGQLRQRLWQSRESRIHPGRDDKILADWNGMMISALARAGAVFDQPAWIDAAKIAFDAILNHLSLADGRLAHSYCQGRHGGLCLVDDLAQMIRAALTLLEITQDNRYLTLALGWLDAADRHYWDDAGAGYFQSADDAGDVIQRMKPYHDGATPSANGVMVDNLARLALITGTAEHAQRADRILAAFSSPLVRHGPSMAAMANALARHLTAAQVMIVGPDGPERQALLNAARRSPWPDLMIMTDEGIPLPFDHPATGKSAVNGKAAAYICLNRSCQPAITDADILAQALHVSLPQHG